MAKDSQDPPLVPEEFGYVEGVVRKFTLPHGYISEHQTLIAGLSRPDMDEIRCAYGEIERRGEQRRMCDLITGHGIYSHGLFQLYLLFKNLAQAGIQPFAESIEQYTPTPKRLDWSTLPVELGYLRIPATIYGIYRCLEEWQRLESEVTEEDIEAMYKMKSQLNTPRDESILQNWLKVYRDDYPEEASLICWLITTIDYMCPDE